MVVKFTDCLFWIFISLFIWAGVWEFQEEGLGLDNLDNWIGTAVLGVIIVLYLKRRYDWWAVESEEEE